MTVKISVLSYNIGFCGGATGLTDGVQNKSQVQDRLARIVAYLQSCQADVIGLQEVDCHSRRSAYVNQRAVLTQLEGLAHSDWVDTWRHPWVPYPITLNWRRHFGPVHAGQLVISRYPILARRCVPLIQRQDRPALYNWFYLHAHYHALCIDFPSGPRWVGHCHLDAFDPKTRDGQVAQIIRHWNQNGVPDMVLGDWNGGPTESMVKACASHGLHVGEHSSLYDYPAHQPSEQLSYVAHRRDWQSHAYVDSGIQSSDHLPLHCSIDMA